MSIATAWVLAPSIVRQRKLPPRDAFRGRAKWTVDYYAMHSAAADRPGEWVVVYSEPLTVETARLAARIARSLRFQGDRLTAARSSTDDGVAVVQAWRDAEVQA